MRDLAQLVVFTFACVSIQACGTSNAQKYPWTVITVAGDTLKECRLDSIRGSDIYLYSRYRPDEVLSTDSVGIMIQAKESHMLAGGLIGSAAGAILGGLVGNLTADQGSDSWAAFDRGVATVVVGSAGLVLGLTGGLIVGGLQGVDEEIPLAGLDSAARADRLSAVREKR